MIAAGSLKPSQIRNLSPHRFIDPKDLVSMESFGDVLQNDVTDPEVGIGRLGDDEMEDEEVGVRDVVELMESSSGLGEKGEEDQPTVGVEIDDPMESSSGSEEEGDKGQTMVGIELKEASSDMMEVDGEGHPAIEVNSKNTSDSLEDLSKVGAIRVIKGAKPLIGADSNQAPLNSIGTNAGSSKEPLKMRHMQTKVPRIAGKINPECADCIDDADLDSLVLPGAPFGIRRSTRNADNAKYKDAVKLVTARKASGGKRKLAKKKDVNLLQASVPIKSSRNMSLNGV
jgi:hypothetical protein